MKLYKGILMVSFLLTSILFTGLVSAANGTTQDPLAEDPLYYLYANTSKINVDGTVSAGEYPDGFPVYSVGGKEFASLSWAYSNDMLYVGIVANVGGWVGFGQGSNGMLEAPMVYGSVSNGELSITDAFGPRDKNTFPSPDSGADPRGDINESAGTETGPENNRVTTIEFSIPLNSSDPKDAAWFVGGTFSFFLAAHKDSDVLVYHTVHSARNLKVKILDDTVAPPSSVSLSEPKVSGSDNLTISTTATVSSGSAANLSVVFAMNTSFGLRTIGVATTDASGVATLENVDLGTVVGDSIELVAVHLASETHSYARSDISTVNYSGEDIEGFYEERILDPPEYEEFVFNPNYFNNSGRLASVIMLFLLLFVVFMLTWEYGKAVVNWVRIAQLGKGIEREEEEL